MSENQYVVSPIPRFLLLVQLPTALDFGLVFLKIGPGVTAHFAEAWHLFAKIAQKIPLISVWAGR